VNKLIDKIRGRGKGGCGESLKVLQDRQNALNLAGLSPAPTSPIEAHQLIWGRVERRVT
jgi:hypothetical protein